MNRYKLLALAAARTGVLGAACAGPPRAGAPRRARHYRRSRPAPWRAGYCLTF